MHTVQLQSGVAAALVAWFAAMTSAAYATTADSPPGAPTDLTAQASNASVALAWSAPASNGGSALTGYNIYEGTAPGGESATPVNGDIPIVGTSAGVSGLVNGTTYYFTVKALNSIGISDASNEVPATPANAPGAPTGLSATPSNTTITLAWTAPASDGGSPVIGYNIYEGATSGGESATPVNVSLVTKTSYAVTGLTDGVAYYFIVKAVSSEGSSAPSNEATATPAVTPPGAPTGLTATAGNGEALLSWTAPASDGGAPIEGYNIYQGTSSGGENLTPINGGTLITSMAATVEPLSNGTTYYFTVKAVNTAGDSAVSNEVSTTPTGPPGAPTGLTAAPNNLSVALSWTAPAPNGSSAVTGYNVFEGTTSGGESLVPVNASLVTSRSYTATGLTNGVPYYFTVEAVNAGGSSPASTETSATPVISVASAPGGFAATPGGNSVSLVWNAPSSDGGSPVTGYDVYEGTTAGGESTTPANGNVVLTSTSATVTGLVNGTTYYFTVKAVNGIGSSAASEEVSATPADPPDAPLNLTASPANDSVSLAWTPPTSNGGSPISAYYVFGGPASGAKPSPANSRALTARIATGLRGRTLFQYVVTGLTDGTTYHFTVRAVNAAGTSPASNVASATPRATSKASFTLSATKVTYGHEQVEHIHARVSSPGATTIPTGTVTIKASAKTVCRITLSSGIGTCTLSSKRLGVGTYDLIANYGGDTFFVGSASAKKILKVVR